MRILLTNDDGYDAPGLAALWHAVRLLPDLHVDIIAPAEPHSGKGHVLSPEIACRRRLIEPIGQVLVVEGTPVDCVCVAMHLPGLDRPDWILAGINRGSNLGVDQYNSGTIAAVRQAAIFGIPAIAVSQLVIPGEPDDWPRSTTQAAAILAAILQPGRPAPPAVASDLHAMARSALTAARQISDSSPADPGAAARHTANPEPPCWNVNLPKLPACEPPRGVCFVPMSREPGHMRYDHRREPDGTDRLSYTGVYRQRPASPGTDVAAAFAGYIAISRLPT